jgi:hypothetical protein
MRAALVSAKLAAVFVGMSDAVNTAVFCCA